MKTRIVAVIFISILFCYGITSCQESSEEEQKIRKHQISAASAIMGLEFTAIEQDTMLNDLGELLTAYRKNRDITITNQNPPALLFNPLPVGFRLPSGKSYFRLSKSDPVTLPDDPDDLAFYSIKELAYLVKNRKITSTALVQFFLNRLKKYDNQLHCVITITEELALKEAAKADAEIARGNYKGLLHGIPYGAKDLLAVKGYKTTWGAAPYKDRIFDYDATVIKKMRAAGAILIAKLTLGALAMGDVWYGEKTRNPWNLEQGSSGSSAGSASATAAGLVPFAIGTETWGSIVSPSNRCGTTGLRPTFGRISRTGAMALSWSMDKIGPICRSVEDCAIVFNALYGPDGTDQSVIVAPMKYSADLDIKMLKIGYLKAAFDDDYKNKENDLRTLKQLRDLGINLVEVTLPDLPVRSLSFILRAEAAAAFDVLTRSDEDDLMVRQGQDAWPNIFRVARFIPAVEYIQANRIRYLLIQQMEGIMNQVDLYVAPSFGGNNLLLTNLTGHPCVILPNGFNEQGAPTSISFIGRLFEEGSLLAFVHHYQESCEYHLQHPPIFYAGSNL
jgi:Asp-tRNA(Asn)/Glu-tRNA(Gln) amidotransferase A subunit family amidase